MKSLFVTCKVLLLLVLTNPLLRSAQFTEVKIMCPGAYFDVLTELVQDLERETKLKVLIIRDGPANLISRMRAGEIVDVVILPDESLPGLVAEGHVKKRTTSPLFRSGIGMAVRAGA